MVKPRKACRFRFLLAIGCSITASQVLSPWNEGLMTCYQAGLVRNGHYGHFLLRKTEES